MASPTNILVEEQVHCSICLDVFTNPVSIPCGHNFCMSCISNYWKSSALFMCPMCKKTFFKQPDISINTVLREIAEQFKEMRRKPILKPKPTYSHLQNPKTESEVQQMIQERLKKVEDIKHCVELNKSSAQREVEDSVQVFSDLVRVVQKVQAELVLAIEEKQRRTERWAESLIQELEQEISLLKTRNSELDHLNFPSLMTHPQTKDWSETRVHTDQCVGTIRRAVSRLEETLTEEIEKLADIDYSLFSSSSFSEVDVTLDPDTANPWLQLSEDRRQVRHLGAWQDLPDTPERFDTVVITLAREGFTAGRHYWEVQVGEKDDWYLGVARASVNRKGRIAVSTSQGYWALAMKKGQEPRLRRVGVYVDFEEGQLSFYDVATKNHIYTFMDSFGEKVHPLHICRRHMAIYSYTAPIIITTTPIFTRFSYGLICYKQ
uniref:Si:dkey-46i9.6 n=1 Tax=Astyanax mexicanus TaxID=7994 RepID=A0A3B1KBX3_ASTMX